jgi:hypothetical protein
MKRAKKEVLKVCKNLLCINFYKKILTRKIIKIKRKLVKNYKKYSKKIPKKQFFDHKFQDRVIKCHKNISRENSFDTSCCCTPGCRMWAVQRKNYEFYFIFIWGLCCQLRFMTISDIVRDETFQSLCGSRQKVWNKRKKKKKSWGKFWTQIFSFFPPKQFLSSSSSFIL